jgi:hypothetical protein
VQEVRNTNWFDVTRLLGGTPSQVSAARTLIGLRIFELLDDYTPVLCGTVPINCDLPGSGLDVACRAPRPIPFEEILRMHFGELPGFSCDRKKLAGVSSVVARFVAGGWKVEIVGQDPPVPRQRAFAHMIAEALLLSRAAPGANERIRELKRGGLTTEEAFGRLFSLPGNPYDELTRIYMTEI